MEDFRVEIQLTHAEVREAIWPYLQDKLREKGIDPTNLELGRTWASLDRSTEGIMGITVDRKTTIS